MLLKKDKMRKMFTVHQLPRGGHNLNLHMRDLSEILYIIFFLLLQVPYTFQEVKTNIKL